MVIHIRKYPFRIYVILLKVLVSIPKKDLINGIDLSNHSPDDKLLNGTLFIVIVTLGVLEIVEICLLTNWNSVG